ncbi:MAG: histidine phosphatase family protein [Clostridia bacterium]|nr:histidine phosphatase family protein [Clostridia bacterium]
MILFYIRHGDPIYNPDSLTPLGKRQAEALAKRLAIYGIDKVFCSTSNRAIETAKPTCELLKLEPELLDFCNEGHAWNDLTVEAEHGKQWVFHNRKYRLAMTDVCADGKSHEWYKQPAFKDVDFKKGLDRITAESDKWLLSLGYRHIKKSGRYEVVEPNEKRIALFAHQGFGLAFLSCILDIPYNIFSNHFDFGHSSMTVIEFKNEGDIAIPKVLTLSSDSHLYREGLPLKYNNFINF